MSPVEELVAAFFPDPKEIGWGRQHLEPYKVTLYINYDEMPKHEGLEAVVIATVTTVHAEQSIKAIEKDLHLLCENPLSTSVEIIRSQQVDDAVKKKHYLKVMCGLSRRFDARIFVGCNVHDIDLVLWFFGQDGIVKSVTGIGITAVQPELKKYGDFDMARLMAAGQHDTTEIIETEGKLTVNDRPASSLVEMHEASGVGRGISQHYYGRFEQAFVTEANEFAAACLDNTGLPLKLSGAVQAIKIGCALQESLRSGKKISFDETGNIIEEAKL
ncbi:hypothetical protein M501DRAFT_1009812 [Patellaria atrata CBS 101060]|uniref:Gfo/Idh/MocA-like oxidoreductase N-terminal domain-containing protein n=1 Tax=Patellaria atrata CBS 101060 TaxID=1346257 RepID=A0A9P4S2V5_9PEZI|nr:hypothetical protein M501DRAFT_1009812 [Patellaria atrata CBS 101060]